jgi:hypothetical protein
MAFKFSSSRAPRGTTIRWSEPVSADGAMGYATVQHRLAWPTPAALHEAIQAYRRDCYEVVDGELRASESAALDFWRSAEATLEGYEDYPATLSDEDRARYLADPVTRSHALYAAERAIIALGRRRDESLLPLSDSDSSSDGSSTGTAKSKTRTRPKRGAAAAKSRARS